MTSMNTFDAERLIMDVAFVVGVEGPGGRITRRRMAAFIRSLIESWKAQKVGPWK